MHTYHHAYHGPGPDHHALYGHDLRALLAAFAEQSDDFFARQSIRRRIEQAVPGMVAPLHVAPEDVRARARRAVQLFEQAAEGDDAARLQLLAFVTIDPGALALGAQPQPHTAA